MVTFRHYWALAERPELKYSVLAYPGFPKVGPGVPTFMHETVKTGLTVVSGHGASPDSGKEVRCAVRFPISLPVVIQAGHREHIALTRNVSASGVLFEMQSTLRVGDSIEFYMRMPGAVLGTPHDVLVDCRGRVVRCSKSQAQTQVAATIDDYQFVEK